MYCDFYSVPDREDEIPAFINAVCNEILSSAEQYQITGEIPLKTIFIGGGTPSLIQPFWIDKILKSLKRVFDLSTVEEITMEANPGEAPFQNLRDLHSLGINRLSMGFQSFQPELLQFLSRIHTASDCFRTFENARKAGFTNINADMIYNIPGQNLQQWRDDLRKLTELKPEHISAYSLTVEKNTLLNSLVQTGKTIMPDEETDILFFNTTRDLLQESGYPKYEVSNFALPGFECRHNLNYWRLKPSLGFGPSAHSFDGNSRWWNTASLDHYISAINRGNSPVAGNETLTQINKFNELIFNGLRLVNGVSIQELRRNYFGDFNGYLQKIRRKWPQIIESANRIRLSDEGMLLADEISSDLFIEGPGV